MPIIILRETNSLLSPQANVKGSPLTNNEVDNNFSNLNISIGVLTDLTTTSNANLVAAINEIRSNTNFSNVNITGGTITGVSNASISGNLTVGENIWANTVQATTFMDRTGNVLRILDEGGNVVWGG